MVDIVKPRYRDSEALSYSWLYNGVRHTVESCTFEYEAFHLSRHGRKRISALIGTLLKEGKITKDPMREKQWVGSFIIQRAVTAFLQDAIKHGTISWDVTISRAASLILVCSLGRSGDVVRSEAYEGLLCLCYKHITIKLVENAGTQIQFTAQFEMAQDKGKKDTKKHGNRKVPIRSQTSSACNVMDPIKWVLILALRMGAVDSKSFEGLVAATKKRRDKTVIWSTPDAPVLLAFRPGCVGVIKDKPAQARQILNTLRLSCELCGILTPVIAHDIRRGTARDVAYMGVPTTVNTDGAAMVLGHSNRSRVRRVTADYIGPQRQDIWSDRIANPVQDTFGLDMIDGSFKRRKHVKNGDVREMCEKNGLDYSIRKERDTASRMIRDQEKRLFVQKHEHVNRTESHGQESIKDLESSKLPCCKTTAIPKHGLIVIFGLGGALREFSASHLNAPLSGNDKATPLRSAPKRKASQLERDLALDEESADEYGGDEYDWDTAGMDDVDYNNPTAESLRRTLTSTSDELTKDDSIIDTQVLNLADIIHGTQMVSSMPGVEDLADPLYSDDEATLSTTPDLLTSLSPTDFIIRYSKINIVRHSQSVARSVDRGGSRDEPNRFKLPCPNAVHGCSKVLETDVQV